MLQRLSGLGSVLVLLCCLVSGQAAWAACPGFSDVIRRGSFFLADAAGRELASCNPDLKLVPASLIKIGTVLAAMRILGPEYRFSTEFFLDDRNNLYIRGNGDPMLVSEEVARALEQLRALGVATINSIFVDDTRFALRHQAPGLGRTANPYDAPVAATAVNFNSVAMFVGEEGIVRSAEPQTPYLEIMKVLGRGLPPGRHRVHVCWRGGRPAQQSARLTGELVRALQRRLGIAGQGRIGRARVKKGARLVLVYRNSHTLRDISRSLLRFSNNFMANLIYLACGAERFGYPATWDKARQAVSGELAGLLGDRWTDSFFLEDGAGLSRQNRVTSRSMTALLVAFAPWAHLLPEKQGVRLKSGTLGQVFNYAGYLPGNRPFVVLLNQEKNTRDTVLARVKALADRHVSDR